MWSALLALALFPIAPSAAQEIRLPRQPQLSPDGETVAFAWQGDVWLAPSAGGTAERLTIHPGNDSSPFFSPDGATIAFESGRSGRSQIHVVPVAGGLPRQVTHDSHRRTLLGFTPDGAGLLVAQATDRGYRDTDRLFVIDLEGRAPKRMLFDAGFSQAALSPSGEEVLFTRGRAAWSRKGYAGAQAMQMWHADLTQSPPALTRLDQDRPRFQNVSCMSPVWAPDGKGFYYISDPDGTFDVYYASLEGGADRRVTRVSAIDRSDDGVAFPSLSADGRTMLLRRRFDLYRLDPSDGALIKLDLRASGDAVASAVERTTESGADGVAFTADGKQMAFVAGGDVFVMDRVLKEPVRVTDTPHQESDPLFSADGERLFYVTDAGGEIDIWEATHAREDGIWWLADEFELRQVTDDRAVERGLALSPSGDHVAFLKGTELFVMDADGSDHRRVVESWSAPSFDWSSDGKWLTYATQDSDYNSDVWIVPLDGTRAPFNLSRHPDSDSDPAWSRDGSRIAWVSRREGEESDIHYINLTREEEEKTERDQRLEEALEAMEKKGKAKSKQGGRRGPAAEDDEVEGKEATEEEPKEGEESEDASKDVRIDFEGIHDRMHRISIPDSRESGLIWSPDGKKLAFSATVDAERGFYTVEFPDVGAPKRLASSGLGGARWLADSKEIVGLSRPDSGGSRFGRPSGGGTPAAMDEKGKLERFSFSVRRVRDWNEVRRIAFDQGWRAMRDRFYDENMNNRDWEAIRKKYRPVAATCIGAAEFSELMNMMLGELNASHMGHRGGSDPLPDPDDQNAWSPTTYHLGLRFEATDSAPGLVVESVIPGSPCHEERSRVEVGEVLLAIDGVAVGPDVDLDALLTLDELRDLELTVADGEGDERTVTVRPTASVGGLLYDEWTENNRAAVEELSDGKLGYLHIRGMNMSSFRDMEEDLYDAGDGKDGLIIDVRFNGGGSTTDHVLTALTQPVHAITRSRGSGEGYPQDRKVYASWSKPIVLMCNEHSFSNAEILSHAVQQLGRGRLVGMRTAGGVISTGSARLLDGSSVRMPTRGWYLVTTGEDMELNGCEPDIALWNPPDGGDVQLDVAVQTLLEDVASEQANGRVKIVPAAERRRRQRGAGDD